MREDGWAHWLPRRRTGLPGLATIVGHRGAAGRAPENTLAGLRTAHQLGATWVEFDVMLSRDGVPVLIHDETLQRTTDGRGRVSRHSAAELRRFDAGAWFAPDFAGQWIPTLEEAIAVLVELGLHANVEIKPATGHEVETGEVVSHTLQRLWPNPGPRLLLSSFERESLAAAQRIAPAIPRGLLAGAPPSDWAAALRDLACTTLHLDQGRVTSAALRMLSAEGVPVLLYTVNDTARARQLLEAGALALFTDLPDVLLAGLAAQ